jgi:hypothetical protein
MKTYKGLRAILAARAVVFDMALPFEGAEIGIDGQAIRGSRTPVDATSGTRTVTEWALHSEER